MKGFIWEAFGIAGIALTFGGIWWLEPPFALIFLGVVLIMVALIGAKAEANVNRKQPREKEPQE